MITETTANSHEMTDKSGASENGLRRLAETFQKDMRSSEAFLHDDRDKFTSPNGEERKMPDAIRDYYKRRLEQTNDPRETQRIIKMRSLMEESFERMADTYTDRTVQFGKKMQIQFGLNAVKKTAAAIQQILSSQ